MFTKELKFSAREIIKKDKKGYFCITLVYLLLTFIFFLLPYVLPKLPFAFFNQSIFAPNQGLIFKILDYSSGLPIMLISVLMITKLLSYKFNENFYSKKSGIIIYKSDFWRKTVFLALFVFLCEIPFTIPVKYITNYLIENNISILTNYSLYNTLNIIRVILNLLNLIIRTLLTFLIYLNILFPTESIFALIKKSIILVWENIIKVLVFDLAFLNWYIIPLILFGISMFAINSVTKTYTQTLLSQINVFLFSPFMYGLGFILFSYINITTLLFCKKLIKDTKIT